MQQLAEQLIRLHRVVSSRCLLNEILLTDIVDLAADFCSRDELKDLLKNAIVHQFMDCVRTNKGVVVTFVNLFEAAEMLSAEAILAEVG